jgi:hypothetical protein
MVKYWMYYSEMPRKYIASSTMVLGVFIDLTSGDCAKYL